jgi:two-component system sensor histidine kinase/response regulator
MPVEAGRWFSRLGLNTRILLLAGLPLVATAAATTFVVHWSTQRFVENAIGDQMVMEARIVAHLVAIAEHKRPQGLTPAEVNTHLKEIARFAQESKGYDYEFWVTDSAGKVTMGTEDIEFTFKADQAQAGAFLPLLARGADRATFVVQESRKREIDEHVYKYVGVSGVDKPRIVEVGYRTDSLLAELAFNNYLLAAGVAGLLLAAGWLAYFTLRRMLTEPLDQLIRAATAVETEKYEVGALQGVRDRGDELGRLAAVFEDMVGKLATRYDSLVNLMRSAVVKVNGDRTITFANSYAAELLGYSGGELVGQGLERIVPPEWHDEVRRRIDSIQGEEVQVNEVNENLKKSGERVWIAWSNRLIRSGEGREKELLCVGNDVTEEVQHKKQLEDQVEKRMASERLLRETEEYYRGVLERAPDGLLVVDSDGRIRLANAQCETLFGYNRDELVGQSVDMLVPDNIRPRHPELRASFLQAPTTRAMGAKSELQARRKDGSLFPVDIGLSPLPGQKGAGIQVAVSIRDITERKQAEVELKAAKQKAEEATRMKSMFLANMSHEIRTPMNAIIGLSHLALKTQLTAKQRDYVSKVHNAGTSLLAVINDILDFSKIEAGRLDVETTDFRLDDVIASVTTVTGQKATDKGLELLAHVAPGIPQFLLGDPLRLGQILTNLVNNAVKFTERGEIVVSISLLEHTGGKCQLKFSVRDTGIGMTAEQSARLFQPFTQADMSTTRKYGGTGLGLTVCRRLVELMGGQIWLDSEPGVGTTFTFTIWVGVGQQKGSGKVVPKRLTTMRALIVDDNAGAREIIDDLLQGIVAHADAVASGPEALAAIKQADTDAPYDVVFMDWRMPGMDGLQAARAIKSDASLKQPPAVVMVTAFGRDEVREEAEHLQLDGFLVKPVTKSMLVDALVSTFADADDQAAAVASATDEGVSLQGLRILLVEDNDINQQIAVELLEGVGAKLDVAGNGQIAVDRLLNGPVPPPYDVVLMDLQMPVMDGHQATARIRGDARFTALPIYAMTAHATMEERDFCLAHGMQGHISKPIDPALLFDTLSKVSRRPADRAGMAGTDTAARVAADAEGELPPIDGLDRNDGLRRVGGNNNLYVKLLRQFAAQQAGAVGEIRSALGAQDPESATRLAHTLKGVAGNLGAKTVQDAAAAVEKALRDRASADAMDHSLDQLAAVLDPFMGRLRSALAGASTEAPVAPAASSQQTRSIAAQLTKLLADFDTGAVTFAEENGASLRPAFDPATWDRFLRHIQDFAFADAQTLLDQAIARLPES